MTIEANYVQKLEEIKQAASSLSEWEQGFIFGKGGSSPMIERSSLSLKQKALIDRIYNERVLGVDKDTPQQVNFGNPRVIANPEGKSYRVAVDNMYVGPNVNSGEAASIVGWLSAVLAESQLTVTVVGASPAGQQPQSIPDDFPPA